MRAARHVLMVIIPALGVAWASPARSAPACRVRAQPFLEGRVAAEGAGVIAPTPRRAVDARLGEVVEVFLALPGTLDGRKVVFGESGAEGRVSWARAGCPVAPTISWRRVEPRMQHEETDSPNDTTDVYSNAVMFGPRHGQWIGFDTLEYFETPIAGAQWSLLVRGAHPTDEKLAAVREPSQRALGAMRLAATITVGDRTWSTPDARDLVNGTIADSVFQYRYRAADHFLGWVTSYFNVPYLFGSAGKGRTSQAERYVGADCADILVAGLRHAGRDDLEYSSVNGLLASLHMAAGPAIVEPCDAHGSCPAQPAPRLRFGAEVLPGDLLALDYLGAEAVLPKPWDHIVALVEDRGPAGKPDGLLGPEDLVADSGSALGLHFSTLGEQGRVRVAVMRLPPRAPSRRR